MAANLKFILLITLAAVYFLPQDGVDAQDSRLTCYACDAVVLGIAECEPGNSKRIYQCPTKTCGLLVYVYDDPDSSTGQRRTRMKMDCGEPGKKIGCYAVSNALGGNGTFCTCNTDSCNSDLKAAGFKENDEGGSTDTSGAEGSPHGHKITVFISVLIFVLAIAVLFLRRP